MSGALEALVRSAALVQQLRRTREELKIILGDMYQPSIDIHKEGIAKYVELAGVSPSEAVMRLSQSFAQDLESTDRQRLIGSCGVIAAYVEMIEDGTVEAMLALSANNQERAEAAADALEALGGKK